MAQADRQYAQARRQMVLSQLRPNKVIDEQVINAMEALPREQFVPQPYRGVAYMDEDVAVAPGRFLMEPMVLARLLQEAELQPQDIALVIGCATGYDVAVLAKIVNTAIGLEFDTALAQQASQTLQSLGLDNVAVVEGALKEGLAKQGPFNVILLAGAIPEISETLLNQLADGGRLIGVVRPPEAPIGQAVIVKRAGNLFPQRVLFDAGTRPLPGFERPAGFVF
ncbi:protein-L-isoaspartate O-methyltransferase [uncultured Ferrovibrio sp.]|jgi:Protein-L-isoaspartate carboxylmethyltransferase|uniref:protein-L-isoaspartate O-methyltransferase family protein n=1 Tax=uncultured Ferrovibrio sp. TaxID=1576913 RepID=UPI00261BC943|nr:protein-L-isoaspartate O-methyltransferase [uncultured Ferrovibrio sp.]